MGDTRLPAMRPELYERLIDRLGLALEAARTSHRLRDVMPVELELRGLSRAEYDVIRHYLEALPAGRHVSPGTFVQGEPVATAKVVWLHGKKRRNARPGGRSLPLR
ncbi:hypothetical protein [Pseudomonas sp. Marseille-QA0332]